MRLRPHSFRTGEAVISEGKNHLQLAADELVEACIGTHALLTQLDVIRAQRERAFDENSRLATLLLAKDATIRALQAKLKFAEARAQYFEQPTHPGDDSEQDG